MEPSARRGRDSASSRHRVLPTLIVSMAAAAAVLLGCAKVDIHPVFMVYIGPLLVDHWYMCVVFVLHVWCRDGAFMVSRLCHNGAVMVP